MTTQNIQKPTPEIVTSAARAAFFVFILPTICTIIALAALQEFAKLRIAHFFPTISFFYTFSGYLVFFALLYNFLEKRKTSLKRVLTWKVFICFMLIAVIGQFIIFSTLHFILTGSFDYINHARDKNSEINVGFFIYIYGSLLNGIIQGAVSFKIYLFLMKDKLIESTSNKPDKIKFHSTVCGILVAVLLTACIMNYQSIFGKGHSKSLEIIFTYCLLIVIFFGLAFHSSLSFIRSHLQPWLLFSIVLAVSSIFIVLHVFIDPLISASFYIPYLILIMILSGICSGITLNLKSLQPGKEQISVSD